MISRAAAFTALLVLAAPALAREPSPSGASACSGCHAAGGAVPAITARPAAEIEAAMSAFRTGARPATLMDRIAKGFTEDETRAIANWLAGEPAL